MTKRKRPEADSVEVSPKVTYMEENVPAERATVGEAVAAERNPAVGGAAGGVPENTGVEGPPPVATGEPPFGNEQGAETIWTLFAKAGYLVW